MLREPGASSQIGGFRDWGAEFFVFFVPGTSPSPGLADPSTFLLLGFEVHGNLFYSGAMIALSVLACLLDGAVGGHESEA